MENRHLSNCRKQIMEQELIRGRDTANQLLEVIVNKLNINLHHHGDLEGLIIPLAQDLVNKVLRSFTNTLFLLNTNNDVFSDEEVLPITIKDLSKCPKLEETDHEACKTFKVQRGCYKRKSNAITWEKDSSILIEDGYEWRKYGQKKIMNAKYIRSYYRCSYKNEQDCAAMKQVQRIQVDPPLYRTTYYGHHNCKTSNLDITSLLEPNNTSSMFINFNDSFQTKEQYPSFSSSSFSKSTKQEPIEVINIPYDHIAENQLISLDYPLSCDYELEFDYLRHATMLSSTQSVEFHDVYEPCSLDFDSKSCFGL
ncbi:unnamed protein product [Trifolium pratense]|uniref:Uncharacterized protein n=1 Tax=Trifolium pratense TaxID=57577 RepID=A0ACB0KSQ3_TRIPR|nr:unnamed protein product [Trifolium pratense]